MRHWVVVAALACGLSVLAQEPASSSAKQAYAALTKSLEKLKTLDPVKSANAYKTEIGKAQKKLEAIKEKEPGFDLSAHEQAIKAFEAALAQGQSDKAAAKDARAKEVADKQAADEAAREAALEAKEAKANAGAEFSGLRQELEAVFRVPHEENYAMAADAAAVFKEVAQRYAAFDAAAASERIKRAVEARRFTEPKVLFEEKSGYDARLAEVLRGVVNPVDQRHVKGGYYTLREYELFWNTLEKTFPDDAAVKENAAKTRKAVAETPGLEAANAKAAAAQKQALGKVKLAPAVRKDAAMEDLFRKAFAAEGWQEDILQVNLLDTDWHIEKNKLTGAIICRYQSAAIKAKNKAGNCIAYQMSMKQDWNGSGYSATPRRYGHNAQYMACEN